jgi:SAM-dependent methyltransferase
MMSGNPICPVCGGLCLLLDKVDFNKSCIEPQGELRLVPGLSIAYVICSKCGFCFAPEFANWSPDEFSEKIYNDQYVLVDPDYVEARPRGNADSLLSLFGGSAGKIRHLDYGSGAGELVKILARAGWNSTSYDPFVDRDVRIEDLGRFDLITAFEVFEHVPDVQQLVRNLQSLLNPDGVVFFSTLLSNGNIQLGKKLTWWYASPRNGHISLFSRNSLDMLGSGAGFNFGSFSPGVHVFFTKVPDWASHFIRAQ